MSTELTTSNQMADSKSLRLAFCLSNVNEVITEYVAASLVKQGYKSASASVLRFLSVLDCGVNYSAEVARKLNVSRQMVSKNVKELSQIGWLQQTDDPQYGNQKVIQFTKEGEQLICDARKILTDMDLMFEKSLGKKHIDNLLVSLERVREVCEDPSRNK